MQSQLELNDGLQRDEYLAIRCGYEWLLWRVIRAMTVM